MKSKSTLAPALRRYAEITQLFSKEFPQVNSVMMKRKEDLHSLYLFSGDKGDYVIGLKRFADDGHIEILWSSGDDPLHALSNLEGAVASDRWKPDKKK